MTADDRPTARPRPAPTGDDPARPSGSAPTTPPPPPPRGRPRRGAQPLVQLNTRVLPVLDDLVALVQDRRGMSKRDVVETALKRAYPAEYKELLASKQASEQASEYES